MSDGLRDTWVGGFAGGCILAALVVADCMAVVAEGRAWAREDAEAEACEKGDLQRLGGAHPDGKYVAGASVPAAPFSEVYDWDRESVRAWARDWNARRGCEGRAG